MSWKGQAGQGRALNALFKTITIIMIREIPQYALQDGKHNIT